MKEVKRKRADGWEETEKGKRKPKEGAREGGGGVLRSTLLK